MKFKILHGADKHILVRNESSLELIKSIENNLLDIENKIIETECDIFVFAGDLFDNPSPTDLERKLLYKFLGRVLNIKTLKEFVFINGNHDILSDKKRSEISKDNNSFDTLNKFIETLTPELSNKITYLKKQQQYISKFNNNIGWISYSLEDGLSNGNNIDWNNIDNSKFNISIFHDILRDYVEDSKLPVRKDKLEKLPYFNDFKTKLILAGDIHKNYKKSENDKIFIYPGSTNQVNYGEGTYIIINENSHINNADEKVLKLYDIELDSENNLLSNIVKDIQLNNYKNYVTIRLETNKVVDNFFKHIEKMLQLTKFGLTTNLVKISLSTVYLEHEFEIYEFIKNYLDNLNLHNKIEISYFKFKLDLENKSESEILIEESNILDDSNHEENLILTEEKLIKLFDTVLDKNIEKIRKNINDDKILDEIKSNVLTLFSEQINIFLSAKSNYKIELESIETNGFMGIGPNKINLDVVGITKINGTNGVGKTTIYNMIYYVIEGILFEYLSKSKRKQNTLLIFNDENINQDIISVRLRAKVNGVSIAITRNAIRKWKSGITDKDKKYVEWQKHVAELQSNVRLDIASKEGQKTFTGDEAENYIKNFFGDIANTILILNNHKIGKLLNTTPEKLKSMILEYIGVDYLNTLKDNLPYIKKNYNLQRPKVNLETLLENYNNVNSSIIEISDELPNLNNSIQRNQIELRNNKSMLDDISKQLIDLGNVENNLNLKNDELNSLVNEWNELKSTISDMKILELPQNFQLSEPIKNPKILELEKLNIEIKNNNLNFQKNIDDENVLINDNKNLLIGIIKSSYNERKYKIDNLINDSLINEYKNELILNDNIIKDYFIGIVNYISPVINKFKDALSSNKNLIVEYQNNIATLSLKLENLNYELESGICNSCNKPLTDNWEEAKFELQNEINSLNLNKKDIEDKYSVSNSKQILIENIIKVYENLFDICNNFRIDELNYFDIQSLNDSNIIKFVDDTKQLLKNFTNISNNYQQIINNLISNNYKFFESFDNSLLKSIYTDNINWLNESQNYHKLIELILNNNFDIKHLFIELEINDNNLIDTIQKSLFYINKINDDIKFNNNIVDDNQKNIDYLNKIFEEDNKNYYDAYKIYNDEVSRINKHNNLINENQLKINNLNSSINNCNEIINNLTELKPKYLYLIGEYNSLKENIDEITKIVDNLKNDKSEKELIINNHINDKNNIKVEIDNWSNYKRDSNIFELYQNIVMVHFPNVIFEYYRNYLNNNLNQLLSDLNFKLYWDNTGELYMIKINNGNTIFRPVQLVSGMQTVFLGLSLIYTICLLNIKNNISHLFIDELSGALNTGKDLTIKENNQLIIDFQEQFVLLINKFHNKKIWIIDHNINNLFETQTIEVVADFNEETKTNRGSKFLIL